MLAHAGRFFFRTRNALFPVLLLTALLAFPPRRFGDPVWNALAALGGVMVILGQTLRVLTVGLDYIKRGGKNKRIYADRLVTGGIYAHCRNPMYTGNMLIALGLLLAAGNPWALGLGGVFVVFAYYAITRGEEAYLSEHFGDQYEAFVARTNRWLPRMRGLRATLRAYRFDWRGVIVKEYTTLYSTLMLLTAVVAVKAWRGDLLSALSPALIVAASIWTTLFFAARFIKKGLRWKARGRMMQDTALAERRRRIDIIDAAVLDLLNQRAIEVDAIFEWKRASSVERVDQTRMDAMLDRLVKINPGPLAEADVRALSGAIVAHFAHRYQQAVAPAAPATSPAQSIPAKPEVRTTVATTNSLASS